VGGWEGGPRQTRTLPAEPRRKDLGNGHFRGHREPASQTAFRGFLGGLRLGIGAGADRQGSRRRGVEGGHLRENDPMTGQA
jgi:hypothetical protein